MKKNLKIIAGILVITGIYFFINSKANSELKGTYKSSNQENKNIVQIVVDAEDNTFIEYIDQREVDKGSVSKTTKNIYNFKSAKQQFEATLKSDNSFDIFIEKINGTKPINIKNSTDINQYFSTKFGDEDEYKSLISSS